MATKIIGSTLGAKALSVDQFFEYLEQLTDEPTKTALYASVAWAYRCIELRANTLSSIPYKVMRGETEIEDFYIEFEDMLWSLEADLCLFGAGYWLKDRPRAAVKELQRLNPQTVRIETNRDGIKWFEQNTSGKAVRYDPELMVYFRYYNPNDDLGPGTSPMQVALQAADLGRNANVWASQFFSHGAIPAVVLHTDKMLPDNELERVAKGWRQITQGVKRAWNTMVLRQGLKPEVIQSPIGDLAMPELFDQIRSQIAVAFGVPQTMLSDAANYATAKEHRLSFYQDTVLPKAVQIQRAMNDQLFEPLGLTFEFDFGSIEALQKDEAEKAEYMRHLVEAKIMTKDEAREQLGLEPMTPDQEEELKPGPLNLPPSGGSSDNGSKPPEPPKEPEPEPVRSALTLAMEADLDKWQRKALAKGADAPFESEFIAPDVMGAIRAALGEAQTEEEVKAAFAAGFREHYWQAYP